MSADDVPLVVFTHLVVTCMPGESRCYRKRFRSVVVSLVQLLLV